MSDACICKLPPKLKMCVEDKHASLLRKCVNYTSEKFCNVGATGGVFKTKKLSSRSVANVIKLFTHVTSRLVSLEV